MAGPNGRRREGNRNQEINWHGAESEVVVGPDPMWWLNHLTGRLDNRRARLALLRRYLEADAPLPDGAENCRDAYIGFQKKARSNYAENITDAVCDRMTVSQFRVGDNAEDDNA